jgi:hypothetical protein
MTRRRVKSPNATSYCGAILKQLTAPFEPPADLFCPSGFERTTEPRSNAPTLVLMFDLSAEAISAMTRV